MLLFFLTCLISNLTAGTKSETKSLEGLIQRLIPGQSAMFKFKIVPSKKGEFFEISADGGKIAITGSDVNSVATGIGYYLKYIAYTPVSWDADVPVQAPATLPLPKTKIRKSSNMKYRFFLNYCTFGYTMPFWTWREWERCIDWMALQGVNMPLAVTGTEKILQDLWMSEGFTAEQTRSFFTDPTHLPWYHMNNLSRWGGPLPQSYIDYGYKMQKKIAKRERELGMKPIMPAFNGRVPVELKAKYPNKKITVLGTGWHWFDKKYYTYFLDPYDPLFATLQKRYLNKLKELYGTDHFYGVDPFNEVTPPSWEPEYLAKTAKTIYETLTAADKKAVWIQMAWLFYYDKFIGKHWTDERIKAMLTAVPYGRLIMLDYYCEMEEMWVKKKKFFGVPFLWCYLGNFGGTTYYNGPLEAIQEKLTKAKAECGGKNLWGLGSTTEGLGVNQVAYEFLFEQAWIQKPLDVKDWIKSYALSRTGGKLDKPVIKGWETLLQKVYNKRCSTMNGGSILQSRPRLEGHNGMFIWPQRHYPASDLMNVWSLFMKASPETAKRDAFQYDLVNVIRQYLGDVAPVIRERMRAAYITGNMDNFKKASKILLGLMEDQEKILETRPEFLFGRWFADAGKIAKDESENKKYAQSARNLLSTWGMKNAPLIEYANRDWAGLTKAYYNKRWKIFCAALEKSIAESKECDLKKLDSTISDFEWDWVENGENSFTSEKVGDTWDIAKSLYKKYSALKLDSAHNNFIKANVGKWDKDSIGLEYKTFSFDISKYITNPSICVCQVKYTRGGKAAKMKDIKIKCNGKVIAEDLHSGQTGNKNSGNVFKLKIDNFEKGAKYTLELEIKALGGTSSFGNVTLEVFPK
jgi:alpha-N-acetylglucosaminidase